MVLNVGLAHEAMKAREFATNPSSQFKRSLYATEDIEAGEYFTEANIRSIRPGYGLHPKYLPKMLGKKADKCYRRGDRIT
jgi:pseudaminic acid synthase